MSDTTRRTISSPPSDVPCDYVVDQYPNNGIQPCGATPTVASMHGFPRRWRLCEEHTKQKHHGTAGTPHRDEDRYGSATEQPLHDVGDDDVD